jgi:hypothetical protein
VHDEVEVPFIGIAYRGGSFTYDNFTPRPGKDDREVDWPSRAGLSTYTTQARAFGEENRTSQVLDTEELGADLVAMQDPNDSEHILIRPHTYEELVSWSSERGRQSDDRQHPLTRQVRQGRIDQVRRPK